MVATNQSLWIYFADAGLVVKSVMLLLFAASIVSWTFIVERTLLLKKIKQSLTQFDELFWSGRDLTNIYAEMEAAGDDRGIAKIFRAGFKEFIRLQKQGDERPIIMEGVSRAMRVAAAREIEQLETHLPFLASVGSTSPYIGLFGTVWGIMTAFHALGNVQQATISMVAPGISEALIATAMGLFAAIPAVLAYNRFTTEVDRVVHQYTTFQEEFSSILHRQVRQIQSRGQGAYHHAN
jgi:biopolymer transport protein TolQ